MYLLRYITIASIYSRLLSVDIQITSDNSFVKHKIMLSLQVEGENHTLGDPNLLCSFQRVDIFYEHDAIRYGNFRKTFIANERKTSA